MKLRVVTGLRTKDDDVTDTRIMYHSLSSCLFYNLVFTYTDSGYLRFSTHRLKMDRRCIAAIFNDLFESFASQVIENNYVDRKSALDFITYPHHLCIYTFSRFFFVSACGILTEAEASVLPLSHNLEAILNKPVVQDRVSAAKQASFFFKPLDGLLRWRSLGRVELHRVNCIALRRHTLTGVVRHGDL
jgi:hypothetical protein